MVELKAPRPAPASPGDRCRRSPLAVRSSINLNHPPTALSSERKRVAGAGDRVMNQNPEDASPLSQLRSLLTPRGCSSFEVASSPVFEDVELLISAQDAGMSGTKERILIKIIDSQPG